MIRRTTLALVAALALLTLVPTPRVVAGEDCCEEGDAPAAKQGEGLLVDLGNAKCPVMGGKIDGKSFSEWNGLRVGHCCPGCGKKFAADAEKLLDKSGVDWKAAVAAAKKVNDAKVADARDAALAELKKTWTVVREPKPLPTGTLVDLANAKCPISDEDVDGTTTVEWNSVRVAVCCPGCAKKVLAAPETVLADAKIEWKAASDAAKAVDAAKGDERAKALAALKAKFKVVRDPATEAAKDEKPKDEKKADEPKK